MATIHADAAGNILRVLRTPEQEAQYPTPPGGTTQTVTFDEATNAAVLAGIDADWDAHRVVGGVLRRGGVAVTLAPDAPARSDRLFVQSNLPSLLSSLRGGSTTAAQLQRALAFLLNQVARS